MIGSSQRPLPGNTTITTNIHAPCRIRTHNPSKRAAANLPLRPRGHWDRHLSRYSSKFLWKNRVKPRRVSGCPDPDSNQLPTTQTNQANVLDVVAGLLSGRSRVRIPKRARNVSLLQKRPDQRFGPPSLLRNMCHRSFQRVKRPRHELTAHRHPVPRLRMGGAIPLHPLCPSGCGQGEFYLYLITGNRGPGVA